MKPYRPGRVRAAGRRAAALLVAGAAAAALGVGQPWSAHAATGSDGSGGVLLSRQSVSTLGVQPDEESWATAVSSNGRYVAFSSYADNIDGGYGGDYTGEYGAYLRDNQTGVTSRLDLQPGYRPFVTGLTMSADGRRLAWVAQTTAGASVVVLLDRPTGTLTEVIPAVGSGIGFRLSPDGTKLVYSGQRDVGGQSLFGVWLYDVATGVHSEVAVLRPGATVEYGQIDTPVFSPDGNWLAFAANTSLLEVTNPADSDATAGRARRPYLVDLGTGQVRMIRAADGSVPPVNARTGVAALSNDTQTLTFSSTAANWGPLDLNGNSDVFTWTRRTGEFTLETIAPSGIQGNGSPVALSPDGTRLAFNSTYSRFVPGDSGASNDVFIKDLTTGQITSPSVEAGVSFGASAWSADFEHFLLTSYSDDLDPLDANGYGDVFLATLPGAASPALQANADGSELTWTRPASASRVVVRAAEGGYPMSATSGTSLYDGTGTSTSATKLTVDRTYGVAAFTYAADGKLVSRKTLTVVRQAGHLTLKAAAPAKITRGSAAHVKVTASSAGSRAAHRPMVLYGRAAGSTKWVRVASGKTSAGGVLVVTVKPAKTWQYQARHAAEHGYAQAASKTVTVKVTHR